MADVIIIGAGVAGISCAVQLKRLGFRPLIIEKSGILGGLIRNAGFIENYPGLEKPLSGHEFANRLEKMISDFAIELVFSEVVSLEETDSHVNVKTSAGTFSSFFAVYAAGTTAKPAPDELSKVSCVYEPWFLEIGNSERVAVVGSGEAGCDYALSLSKRGFDVTMLVRGCTISARGVLKSRVYDNEKIKIIHDFTIINSFENDGIKLIKGMTPEMPLLLEFHHIVLATGRKSDAEKYGIKSIKGVETNFKRIYIAGDAARGSLGQLATAAGDGIRCAQIIAEKL